MADLTKLLAEETARVAQMTPAERMKMLDAQRESWRRAMQPCEHGKVDFEECPNCRAKRMV